MEKTKVVGVSYDGRQEVIKNINEMLDKLIAIREPENPYDSNAIAIYVVKPSGEKKSIGYIESSKTGLAAKLSAEMDAGKELIIHNYVLTGTATKGMNLGVIFDYSLRDKVK
jgi:single-stranded-DNA-specific exonuclease